jgi:hypothetical protein
LTKPETPKITANWVTTFIKGTANDIPFRGIVIVGKTNKFIANINLDLACTTPFQFQGVYTPTDTMYLNSSTKGSDNKSVRVVLSVPWPPGTPLVVSGIVPEKDLTEHISCSLRQHS